MFISIRGWLSGHEQPELREPRTRKQHETLGQEVALRIDGPGSRRRNCFSTDRMAVALLDGGQYTLAWPSLG